MSGHQCRSFFTLCGMAVFLSSLGDCSQAVCHCWDEMNDVLKAEIQPSNSPINQFSYAGVKRVDNDTFTPCVCSDVVRWRSTLAVNNSTLAEDIRRVEEGNNSLVQLVALWIQEAFIELLNVKDPKGETLDIYVTFVNLSHTNVNESIWELEVVTKGRSVTEEMITSEIRDKTKSGDGEYIIPDVGRFAGSDLSFETLKCTGIPAAAPPHGARVWKTNQQYPADVATYKCDPGYILVKADNAVSTCSHENLTWSSSSDIRTCEPGCSEDPPASPYFTLNDWEPTMRKEGEKLVYYCMYRYRSISGENGSSTCENSQWTPLQSDFKCERILCPNSIPQVPVNADTDYDLVYRPRFVDTRIKYFCIDGYISTVKGDVYSSCDPSGNWKQLPPSFQCISLEAAKKSGLFYGQRNNIYGKRDPQRNKTVNNNWFLLITAPSALGTVIYEPGMQKFTIVPGEKATATAIASKPQTLLKMDRFPFIRPFLQQEWEIVEDEIENWRTSFNASSEVIWLSYRKYLERNGYADSFSSRVLMGKLLSQCGVKKMKKGPRGSQKTFYFPLKPVKGTEAESLLLKTENSKYNNSLFRMSKNLQVIGASTRDSEIETSFSSNLRYPKFPEVEGLVIKLICSHTLFSSKENTKEGIQLEEKERKGNTLDLSCVSTNYFQNQGDSPYF